MKYGQIVHGRFSARLNRFIAEVFVGGVKERVHIKNTGRLKELLLPDAEVLLEVSGNPLRQTRYSLIAAAKEGRWVNIDSQAPNAAVFEAVQAGKVPELGPIVTVKREVSYGDSRFDLYYEHDRGRGFVEVKGVTLEQEGVAMFPDAPTARGTKHVLEMVRAVRGGYAGAILFLVQMKGCRAFTPHRQMDTALADALLEASRQGVHIIAYDAVVTENGLWLDQPLPVIL